MFEDRNELAPAPGLVDVLFGHQAADRGAEHDVGEIEQDQREQEVRRCQAEETEKGEGIVADAVLAYRRIDADRKDTASEQMVAKETRS